MTDCGESTSLASYYGWTQEQVEAAREAAWRQTQVQCRTDPFTSMCARDADMIAFAILRALADEAVTSP